MKYAALLSFGCAAGLLGSLAACKKDEKTPLDPDRPRRMTLEWTMEGTAPGYVSVGAGTRDVFTRVVTASGQWDTTARPSQLPQLAASVGYAGLPAAGNRLLVAVKQDGQVLPGRTGAAGVAAGTTSIINTITVSMVPDASR